MPSRVPMSTACNPRIILSDPKLNPDRITFEAYMADASLMLEIQARFQKYVSENFVYDRIMGFENLEGISAYPDYQNVLEAAWYGSEIAYHGINEPGTHIAIREEEDKSAFLKQKMDPFGGIMEKAFSQYEYFKRMEKEGYWYEGKPLKFVSMVGMHTDGPFTIGCCLRGTTELCMDLYLDEPFAMDFLEFLTETTIQRIKAIRKHLGYPEKSDSFFFADDSIALLSIEDYKRFILPFHKRLVSELSTGKSGNSIHLCGDASRFFPLIRDELNVTSFDTGFPINFKKTLTELGLEVHVSGGVHVDILRAGTTEQVAAETRRILEEVKPLTRKFTIKEANNLSPGTPPENILAMYNTVLEYGRYDTGC